MVAFDKEPEEVEFNADLVKDCLRFLKKYDVRWTGFKKEEFNSYLYPAHTDIYHAVRNRLTTLHLERQKDS